MDDSGGVDLAALARGRLRIISTAPVVLDHLRGLTGEHGLFEHALHDEPRRTLGYTVDDNARALVVLCRYARVVGESPDLQPYLGMVVSGVVAGGWHNRMTPSGLWDDLRGSDDAHARAIWGLGEVLAAGMGDVDAVDSLRAGIVSFESTYPRPVSYAIFGGVAALEAGLLVDLIGDFLTSSSGRLPSPASGDWIWPEPKLTYANARIPEAMIRVGEALGDGALVTRGLEVLAWLIDTETGSNGFSFTPVAGRGPAGMKPAFDQQPIEAWAMADACFAAGRVDGDEKWACGVVDAATWFLGRNDCGAVVYDATTGAGFDGLCPTDVNRNRGAESTLSALGSLIRLRQVTMASS